MNGCIYKRDDGRCDKPGKYMAFCIGEACASQTPSHYDRLISKTPEELAKWIVNEECSPGECHPMMSCEECWLSWLKSPVSPAEVDE